MYILDMIHRISNIERLISKGQSVLVLGPRGAGKSYYVNSLMAKTENKLVYDLLGSEEYQKYLQEPSRIRHEIEYILNAKSSPGITVFIDEVQKIPALLDEAQKMIDAHQNRCVFILTGSSARKLKRGKANLLAGRALFVPFFPLNHQEIDFAINLHKILQFGTLPKAFVQNDEEVVENYLKTYAYSYLKEEILEESLARNIDGFSRFLEIAAFENGNPINHSKIAGQVGVSDKTVAAQFQILEDTLIAKRIPAWTYSPRKQMTRAAKYYFFDNGILNSLTGELSTELKQGSYRFGKLFENLVVNEIMKFNTLSGKNLNLYCYRTSGGQEIDLLLQRNVHTPPIAVEIKSSTTPTVRDVKPLERFSEDYPNSKRFVICRTQHPFEEEGIEFLPFPEGIERIFE